MKTQGSRIEELYRQTFDGFEADIPDGAWSNIEQSLDSGLPGSDAPQAVRGPKAGGLIAGGAAVVGIIVAGWLYFGNPGAEQVAPQPELRQETVMPPDEGAKVEAVAAAPAARQETQAPIPSVSNEQPAAAVADRPDSHEYFTASDEVVPLPRQEASVNRMNRLPASSLREPAAATRPAPDPGNDVAAYAGTAGADPSGEAESADHEAAAATYTLSYPNIITPNGDGLNEIFVVESEHISGLQVWVYDMNSRLVHYWNNLHGFWDGTLDNGEPAPEGKYVIDIFAIREDGQPPRKQRLTLTLKR